MPSTHDNRGQIVHVNGIDMHYIERPALDGREEPVVVLLHGWPQTSWMWRHMTPALAPRWATVTVDLRGYGLTDKPTWGYDKRTMAADVRELVHHLGYEQVILIGHDRGARVAHRYALDYPDQVDRLALLDIVPTREVLRRLDATLACGYWHWFFHFLPDLPEALVGDNVDHYLRWFFEQWAYRREMLDEDAVQRYVAAFRQPEAMRASLDDYRATMGLDIADDDASASAGRLLTMPLLVLWGAKGLIARLPVHEIWSAYATDVTADAVQDCGHFLAEEQPAVVGDLLTRFLDAR